MLLYILGPNTGLLLPIFADCSMPPPSSVSVKHFAINMRKCTMGSAEPEGSSTIQLCVSVSLDVLFSFIDHLLYLTSITQNVHALYRNLEGSNFFRFAQLIFPSNTNSLMARAVPGALQMPCKFRRWRSERKMEEEWILPSKCAPWRCTGLSSDSRRQR